MSEYRKPLPVPDEFSAPYWAGARERLLLINRCQECGTYNHPPKPVCPGCHSEQVEPSPVSGRGHVYSYSIMYNRGNPGFEEETPYAVVIVELEEQPGLLTVGNLLDCDVDDITFDMPVEVTFQDVTAEVALPQFRPAASA